MHIYFSNKKYLLQKTDRLLQIDAPFLLVYLALSEHLGYSF